MAQRYEYEINGIKVVSCVEPVEPTWHFRNPFHIVWSYASWCSWILLELGHPGMRRVLAKLGWWPAPSEKKIEAMKALRKKES